MDLRPIHRFEDAAGKVLIAADTIGRAHIRAHELFDRGDVTYGRAWLADWLDTHEGAGSGWVHLHFHQALFELMQGDWAAAYARFHAHVLPGAMTGDEALTDAPALAWWLALATPRPVELPWTLLSSRALARLEAGGNDPFVAMHHLLALAGAGDMDNLERWLRATAECDDLGADCLLRRLALALRDYVGQAFESASEVLARLLPHLSSLGGSFAQLQLFAELARSLHERRRAA